MGWRERTKWWMISSRIGGVLVVLLNYRSRCFNRDAEIDVCCQGTSRWKGRRNVADIRLSSFLGWAEWLRPLSFLKEQGALWALYSAKQRGSCVLRWLTGRIGNDAENSRSYTFCKKWLIRNSSIKSIKIQLISIQYLLEKMLNHHFENVRISSLKMWKQYFENVN